MSNVDWATATFLDRLLHGLWLDPEDVRVRYDVASIAADQSPVIESLIEEWRKVAPSSDATVMEFDFKATGNAKKKLLRRLSGHVVKRRGGLILRSAKELRRLPDFALAYDIVARECGGSLLGWRYLASPIPE